MNEWMKISWWENDEFICSSFTFYCCWWYVAAIKIQTNFGTKKKNGESEITSLCDYVVVDDYDAIIIQYIVTAFC
mgnify:CR=1 FL=1